MLRLAFFFAAALLVNAVGAVRSAPGGFLHVGADCRIVALDLAAEAVQAGDRNQGDQHRNECVLDQILT
jgi:hypothetical protein